MKTYKVPKLSTATPHAEQSKLVSALKAVHGVENAVLRPESNEFEIKTREQQQPKHEDIASAVSKAGFALSAK